MEKFACQLERISVDLRNFQFSNNAEPIAIKKQFIVELFAQETLDLSSTGQALATVEYATVFKGQQCRQTFHGVFFCQMRKSVGIDFDNGPIFIRGFLLHLFQNLRLFLTGTTPAGVKINEDIAFGFGYQPVEIRLSLQRNQTIRLQRSLVTDLDRRGSILLVFRRGIR